MISYTVHEPPNPPADRADRAEALVFVREGFTYSAFVFTPLWLLIKKQWIAFAGYVAALAFIVLLIAALELEPTWYILLSSALHFLIGFEADTIQRWSLDRAGYHMLGTVSGRSEAECERRFFEGWLPDQPVIAGGRAASGVGTLAAASDILGATRGRGDGEPRGWLGRLTGR